MLADAAARDVPVVLLAAGASAASRSLVAAHSGALAAGDGAWQALAVRLRRAPGRRPGRAGRHPGAVLRLPPRAAPGHAARGSPPCTTPASSGRTSPTWRPPSASRSRRSPTQTRERLAAVLDPGLEPGNPLDVWGTGRDPEALFTETLSALADDAGVGAVALAVDLVPEYDGDDSYRDAVLAAAAATAKPVVVLASVPAAIDPQAATRLRAAGVPVLESTRSGLLALRHLLAHGRARHPHAPDASRPLPPRLRPPR